MNADELKYPGSHRIYVQGKLHPDVRVSMREVVLEDSLFPDGTTQANEPVRLYDCSGPWGDEEFRGDVQEGLPAMRRGWIESRGDVVRDERGVLRARDVSAPPTQRAYALRGVITPEMEYVAIRENLGREEAFRAIYDGSPFAR